MGSPLLLNDFSKFCYPVCALATFFGLWIFVTFVSKGSYGREVHPEEQYARLA
eukprot:NODE_12242_length_264_cov_123.248804.p3 GENE.NODE_12242_length_264_cov_123.248804~~NODE_12242_length_264_cov_123.248804.p3  ORF type:complete len:53 (+),score=17.16 NODE_12242_length_264_cov_123.248804:3-161(+)